VDLIKSSIKEKVIRVCLMTLKNMLEKAAKHTALPMTDNKLLKLTETLAARKWADEDILEDVNYLSEQLREYVTELSSFDEYADEVRSGHLEWSPVHRVEQFWRFNAQRLNEKNYELLKLLNRSLIATNPVVLAVACHDFGEYVRVYPRGKSVVQELGAKAKIMELMSHENASVRYEALLAVQKFLVDNWEYLNKDVVM